MIVIGSGGHIAYCRGVGYVGAAGARPTSLSEARRVER